MTVEHSTSSIDRFETQLRVMLDKIPAFAWFALPHGGLCYLNTRSADFAGLPADHPLRFGTVRDAGWDTHLAMLHPDDHAETRRVWSTCLKTRTAGEVTFRARASDGTFRWFLSRAEPLWGEDGTLLYWIGVNLDVEERRQAEFYLAEAQRLGRTGSWAFDASGFRHWSPELFSIHGLDRHDKPPTLEEYMTLVHPDDREFVERSIERMFAEHRGFDFTKRIIRPDGAVRYVRCVGVANGDTFVGTGMDVTEQEELTAALRKREMELRQMLDFTPQHICVFGPNRERLHANRIALAYFGLSLEEWQGRTNGHALHPDDVESFDAALVRSAAAGSAYELEVRLRRFDGSYRWVLARYNPVSDDTGQVLRWYVACTDIEDRKAAEEKLQQENIALREAIVHVSMFEEIIGTSGPLEKVLAQVAKVAQSSSTVLITGETGTGKELVARAIHRRSARRNAAFIGVNCSAVPHELIASELFGHEAGAFTGATRRRLGRFELAQGGTLFLDEVGDLPLEIQVALLRVLQEREFERVGGCAPIRADVRIIAATNRDLQSAITNGTFRSDLFYRLNVFPIDVPPLRERDEDIPFLVEYFVDRYARQAGKTIRRVDKCTLANLRAYSWPGNVRELQNVIERSVILCEDDELHVDEKWLVVERQATITHAVAVREREMIEAALRASSGRVYGPAGAATRLGIPRSTLESKIRALGINKNLFRSS